MTFRAYQPPYTWNSNTRTLQVFSGALATQSLMDPHLDVVPRAGLLRNAPLRSIESIEPSPREFLQSWFSLLPEQQHLHTKSAVVKAVRDSCVPSMEKWLSAVARELAVALTSAPDLLVEYLVPFWEAATCRLYGLAPEEGPRLSRVARTFGTLLASPWWTPQAENAASQCMRYLHALTARLIRCEEWTPLGCTLKELSRDRAVGGEWFAAATLAQLVSAGFQPTITAAVLGWIEYRTLATGRANQKESAVAAEMIRLAVQKNPPFPLIHRWVASDCGCLGIELQRGDHIVIRIAEANSSGEQSRGAMRHGAAGLSFGHGRHYCAGAQLATLLAEAAVSALVVERPQLQPASTVPIDAAKRTEHLLCFECFPCVDHRQ